MDSRRPVIPLGALCFDGFSELKRASLESLVRDLQFSHAHSLREQICAAGRFTPLEIARFLRQPHRRPVSHRMRDVGTVTGILLERERTQVTEQQNSGLA
jgi:hypothetical protein